VTWPSFWIGVLIGAVAFGLVEIGLALLAFLRGSRFGEPNVFTHASKKFVVILVTIRKTSAREGVEGPLPGSLMWFIPSEQARVAARRFIECADEVDREAGASDSPLNPPRD
jgi:hypothetical protein